MLKKRLVACILVRDGIAVQSFGFKRFLPVGKPEIAAEYFNRWSADEILLLDISATKRGRPPDYDLIASVARHCFVPLTYGGGIRTVEEAVRVVQGGADKVAINAAFAADPTLTSRLAERLGSQCVVVGLDVTRTGEDGDAELVVNNLSGHRRNPTVCEAAFNAECLGAGEILVNSVDRDGAGSGYDLGILRDISQHLTSPIIALGGARHANHVLEALAIPRVMAAAIGNALHHVEQSLLILRAAAIQGGAKLRHESYADYRCHPVGSDGRLRKYDEKELSELRFVHHPVDSI